MTFPTYSLSSSSRETDCSRCRIMPTSPLNLAERFFFFCLCDSVHPGASEPNSEPLGNFPRLPRRRLTFVVADYLSQECSEGEHNFAELAGLRVVDRSDV